MGCQVLHSLGICPPYNSWRARSSDLTGNSTEYPLTLPFGVLVGQPQGIQRKQLRHSECSCRDVNKTSAANDSVLVSLWTVGRLSNVRAVHTIPLISTAVLCSHRRHCGTFGAVWTRLLTPASLILLCVHLSHSHSDCREASANVSVHILCL
jgi:hypothetical protein